MVWPPLKCTCAQYFLQVLTFSSKLEEPMFETGESLSTIKK